MNFFAKRGWVFLLAAAAAVCMYGCGGSEPNGVTPPSKKYSVQVESEGIGATGDGQYAKGAKVTIYAGKPAAEDLRFIKWETLSDSVVFDDSSRDSTWFRMPGDSVKVTAKFGLKDGYYEAEVVSAGTGATGVGVKNYKTGDTVRIYAGTVAGADFSEWKTEKGGVAVTPDGVRDGGGWFIMPGSAVKVSAVFAPKSDYNEVKVVSPAGDAFGGGYYTKGYSVMIYAGTAPEGAKFKEWTSDNEAVVFLNDRSDSTTFAMPDVKPNEVVKVTAVFESKSPGFFFVTAVSGEKDVEVYGGGSYEPGRIVRISTARLPRNFGKLFGSWSSEGDGVVFADSQNAVTSFVMPRNDVTVTARFTSPRELKMVFVEGGPFMMGCTNAVDKCNPDEKPAHRVTVNDFFIGKHEVTFGLWRSVMGRDPQPSPGTVGPPMQILGDEYPVYGISQDDAWNFIGRLQEITRNRGYRLPTEAEWEYAARGGNRGGPDYIYSGGDVLDSVGWYFRNNTALDNPAGVKRVGERSPNALNIYDMSGNAAEWVVDWYESGYYSVSSSDNPGGPPSGQNPVKRGGSFEDQPEACRVSFRGQFPPVVARNTGLRIVLDLAPSP